MSIYTIEFYETPTGKEPAREFIDSLDKKMQAKVLRTIDLLEVNGPALRAPHSEQVGDGIFELRVKQGSDITRVLYFFQVGKRIILTNGYIKKTQKIPVSVLELARRYREDYKRRHTE